MIKILLGFAPWIVYFLLIGPKTSQIETAVIAAIITFLAVDLKALKRGFILAWGTMLFLVFMLIVTFLFNHNWVTEHPWIISNGALGVIAFGSLIIKKPFTLQYAKLEVEKSKWSSPVFYRINFLLSLYWGLIFAFATLVHIVKLFHPEVSNIIYSSLSNGATILGIIITAKFPQWYRQRSKQHAQS